MYYVFNKILKDTRKMANLSKTFDPFTAITVNSDIKTNGKYEDRYHIVRKD